MTAAAAAGDKIPPEPGTSDPEWCQGHVGHVGMVMQMSLEDADDWKVLEDARAFRFHSFSMRLMDASGYIYRLSNIKFCGDGVIMQIVNSFGNLSNISIAWVASILLR